MPKKLSINTKAEEARERKETQKKEKSSKEQKEKEDQVWEEAAGPKKKSQKKKEEDEARKAEAAAKKLEAKKLAAEEEKEVEKSLKKPNPKANRVGGAGQKITAAELLRQKEQDAKELEKKAGKKERVVAEYEYENLVNEPNLNKIETVVDARNIDEALQQLDLGGPSGTPDKHPEKRLKAAYKAFEEAELPQLRAEKPGLTQSQYKEALWKLWKKSPDNPLNQQ
ncbi:hypothetical protein KFL_002800200 [Klebsormidium nitens]|uniref:Coiled-coil domain-containing protein n=1 Tax=Klebsormidium nitens TaxID=105231 RepID=A0A1Y1I5Q3_KLENI|nr:hypothetical protein KFL_002800200 [Klebsormidium nitens]|eukprot:GAQ86290.1 hypothetical protein KFL_002800200 [Klebsormidium nitens]